MNRIDRLFGILTLLQAKKYITAEKIADNFDISVRTVYRDVKALTEQGIPVGFEPHKGYYVMQGYFLPPVSFTTEEANALLLTQSIVYAFTDQSIRNHYANALNKVKAVMDSSDRDKLELLNERIKMQVPACINYSFEYLSVLQQSISAGTIIEIEYKNNKEEISKRSIEPIGLLFYALNWHLIGWCHLRGDYRDFRVSRFTRLCNTGKKFTRTDHTDLDTYMRTLQVNY